MANTVRGEMLVKIGDTELKLVPTFRRIAKLEAALGRSLLQVAQSMGTAGVTFQDVVTILDTMSVSPKPSTDEIGNLVVSGGLTATVPALHTFFEHVLTGGGGDEENPTEAVPNTD